MQSALELFTERGFEQTTALEVAQRAGVTERTFFRYFSDKREVLFEGSGELLSGVVGAITGAPVNMAPIDIVTAAMQEAAERMEPNRPYSIQRAAVVAANASLHERELLKLDALSAAAAHALHGRGVPELAATMAAESGVSVFKVGFDTWVGAGPEVTFAQCIHACLDELKGLTAAAQ